MSSTDPPNETRLAASIEKRWSVFMKGTGDSLSGVSEAHGSGSGVNSLATSTRSSSDPAVSSSAARGGRETGEREGRGRSLM